MTDRVASLAALLRDFEDFLREELSLPRFREAQSHLAGIRNTVGSRLGEPSPEGRGTPSEAQMQAAREGWSGNLPLPSDAELRVLIEAVNRAAWPDRGVRTGSEETPQ